MDYDKTNKVIGSLLVLVALILLMVSAVQKVGRIRMKQEPKLIEKEVVREINQREEYKFNDDKNDITVMEEVTVEGQQKVKDKQSKNELVILLLLINFLFYVIAMKRQ